MTASRGSVIHDRSTKRRARGSWNDDAFIRFARGFFYLGCLTMPMLLLRVGGVTISDVALVLSAVLTAATLAKRPRVAVPCTQWIVGGGVIAAASVLAGFSSDAPAANLAVAARLIFLWWVWRWQASSLLFDDVHFRRAITAYLIGGAASAAAGAAQIALGVTILGQGVGDALGVRASGLTGQVNDQGGALGIGVVLGVGLFLERRSKATALLVLACGGGLVLSGSVTGMLCGAVGILVVLWRNGLRGRVTNIVKLAALIAVAASVATYFQGDLVGGDPLSRFKTATGLGDPMPGVSGPTSTGIRFQTWDYAWQQIQANPFIGVGLGGESGYLPGTDTQTHNMILLFWFQGGLLGLAALLIVLASAIRLAMRETTSGLNATFVGAAAGGLLFAMTAPIVYQRYFWLPLVLLIAYSTSSRSREGSELERRPGAVAPGAGPV